MRAREELRVAVAAALEASPGPETKERLRAATAALREWRRQALARLEQAAKRPRERLR